MLSGSKRSWVTVIVLCVTTPLAWAFSLSVGTPTACDDLTISWTGGTAPFQIFLTPVFGTPRILKVPPSAFNNGRGSFTTQLAFSAKQKMTVTLFDSSPTSGSSAVVSSISTNILTVGKSRGGSCNSTDPGVDFPFELNTALQQCRPYTFSGYSGAVQPVSIIGLIPSGQSFKLVVPPGSTSFDWIADVAAETSIIFIMLDSQGRNGGSSDVKQVGISNDNSCLDRSSPSSTAGPSSTTSDAMPTRAGATSPSATSTHGVSAGIIIGAIAGGLILIAVLGGLVYFFLRKQNPRRHPRSDIDLSFEPTGATSRVYPYPISSSTNLTRPYAPPDSVPIAEYEPRPFILPPRDPEPLSYAQSRHSRTNSQSELLSPGPSDHSGPPRTFTSTAQRKAAMAGLTAYKPSRFILHTDLDEEPHDEEVIELPPQYSENRRPLEIVDSHATHSPPPTQPPPDHTTPGSS